MNKEENYLHINRTSWNNRVKPHMKSAFYDLPGFLQGKSSLNTIELDLLGEVSGKSILHLQCHFGQDSISLSRMGAKVTGIDLSDQAITEAKNLAETCNTDTRFICCDLYSLPEHLDETFDLVFTSYGTIGWLPDLDRWAGIISQYLKPGGEFIMAEFHPVVWMFDDDLKKVTYGYFNHGPIMETISGSYADKKDTREHESITWNHSLQEILENLLQHNLSLKTFKEHDFSPYNCLNNMVETSPGKFQIEHMPGKIPLVFSLKALKTN